MTTKLNPRAICQSVKDETLLLQYNPNNTQVIVPKKLKWNEITQGDQWELKDLTNPKPIKPLTTPSKIIQHTYGIVQIEFDSTSKYSFNQDFISTRSSTSNTNLNSVDFTPKIPIPVYQQQESPHVSLTHSDIYHNQVNISHKKNYKKTSFTPNVVWIKSYYFSPYNNTKRTYFQTFLPQARNVLRKQYEKYMNQKKMTIPFFYWFFKLRKQESNS